MHNTHFGEREHRKLESLKHSSKKLLRKVKQNIPCEVYYLTQSDFEGGTFRIIKSGKYILKEDICFGPNKENDFRPYRGDSKYSGKAYSLGFFAALTIEVDGVEIDLNGKTLKQSDEMAWMQRFYANIETAPSPFIKGQGPGDFGKMIVLPKYIYIHNGTLGRSSHHAIHGNGNKYVVVENVKMVDYEFVGSAFNGGKYILHKSCLIDHNFKDLKVLASWSAAIFAHQFAESVALECSKIRDMDIKLFNQLRDKHLRLKNSIETTKKELLRGREVSNPLYRNEKKIGDGNVYGILSNPLGVAINDFASAKSMKSKEYSSHFYIDNCEIRNIEGDVDEVVGFVNENGEVQKGPAGDILKIKDCTDKNYRYTGNVISDMIMILAKIKQMYPQINVGTLNIDSNILLWSENKMSFQELQKRGYLFHTGKDSMDHSNKGVLGIRIDGTKNVLCDHVTVKNVVNHARLASTLNKNKDKRYLGGISCGIHVSQGKNMWINKTAIERVKSYNSQSCGLQSLNQSECKCLDVHISNINSGRKHVNGEWVGKTHEYKDKVYQTISPNMIPSSIGISYTSECNAKYENVVIKTIEGPQTFYIAIT